MSVRLSEQATEQVNQGDGDKGCGFFKPSWPRALFTRNAPLQTIILSIFVD